MSDDVERAIRKERLACVKICEGEVLLHSHTKGHKREAGEALHIMHAICDRDEFPDDGLPVLKRRKLATSRT